MSEPLRLFQPLPPCANCHGTGRVRDRDGEAQECDSCRGTGQQFEPCIAAGCDTPAVDGPWCPDHDPAVRPFPKGF